MHTISSKYLVHYTSMVREGFLLRFIVTTAFTATYILARSRLACKVVHDVPLSFIETFPSLFFITPFSNRVSAPSTPAS